MDEQKTPTQEAYGQQQGDLYRNLRDMESLIIRLPAESPERETLMKLLARQEQIVNGLHSTVGRPVEAYQRDPKSGIFTLDFLKAHAYQMMNVAAREGGSLSLILGDAMNLKGVNEFSYADGDTYLAGMIGGVKRTVRAADVIAKNSTASDEIFILCPNTDTTGALRLEDKLRETFSNNFVPLLDGSGYIKLGVAFGSGTFFFPGKESFQETVHERIFENMSHEAEQRMKVNKKALYEQDPAFERGKPVQVYQGY